MSSEASSGVYTFELSEKIICKNPPKNRDGVEFDVNDSSGKLSITRFKITVNGCNEEDSMSMAKIKACRLTNLISAKSSMHVTCCLKDHEFTNGKTTTLSTGFIGKYHIESYTDLNVSDKVFNEIIDNKNTKLNQYLSFNAMARNLSQNDDPASAIRCLYLAIEDEVNELNKFKTLRNAVSHNGKLRKSTLDGLENEFGKGYFELTSYDGFDFDSPENKKRLKEQADKFFELIDKKIKDNLTD